MPRKAEIQAEETVVNSPLRRSSRINITGNPPTSNLTSTKNSQSTSDAPETKVPKTRRASLSQENADKDDKKENKPVPRGRRGSTAKEETEQKVEPAKPRTRRSSAALEPTKAEESKPISKRRRSSATEELSEPETARPLRGRRSSITSKPEEEDSEKKNLRGKKTSTKEEIANEEPARKSVRGRRSSVTEKSEENADIETEKEKKRPARGRRASTDKLEEEPEAKTARLTPSKTKRRLSITESTVILEPIEEQESDNKGRKSNSPKNADLKVLNISLSKGEPSEANKPPLTETKAIRLTPVKSRRRPSVAENAINLEPIKEQEAEVKTKKTNSPTKTKLKVVLTPSPPKSEISQKYSVESKGAKAASVKSRRRLSISENVANLEPSEEQQSEHRESRSPDLKTSNTPPVSKEMPAQVEVDVIEPDEPVKVETPDSTAENDENIILNEEQTEAVIEKGTSPTEVNVKVVSLTPTKKNRPGEIRKNLDLSVIEETSFAEDHCDESKPDKIMSQSPIHHKKGSTSPETPRKSTTLMKHMAKDTEKKDTSENTNADQEDIRESNRMELGKEDNDNVEKDLIDKSSSNEDMEKNTLDEHINEEENNTPATLYSDEIHHVESANDNHKTEKELLMNQVNEENETVEVGIQISSNVKEDDNRQNTTENNDAVSTSKVSYENISMGSDGSFKFHLNVSLTSTNSQNASQSESIEEADDINISITSNSSNKENMEINIPENVMEPQQIKDEIIEVSDIVADSIVNENKARDVVARISNVFRPKMKENSFMEPMDVDEFPSVLEITQNKLPLELDESNVENIPHAKSTPITIRSIKKLGIERSTMESEKERNPRKESIEVEEADSVDESFKLSLSMSRISQQDVTEIRNESTVDTECTEDSEIKINKTSAEVVKVNEKSHQINPSEDAQSDNTEDLIKPKDEIETKEHAIKEFEQVSRKLAEEHKCFPPEEENDQSAKSLGEPMNLEKKMEDLKEQEIQNHQVQHIPAKEESGEKQDEETEKGEPLSLHRQQDKIDEVNSSQETPLKEPEDLLDKTSTLESTSPQKESLTREPRSPVKEDNPETEKTQTLSKSPQRSVEDNPKVDQIQTLSKSPKLSVVRNTVVSSEEGVNQEESHSCSKSESVDLEHIKSSLNKNVFKPVAEPKEMSPENIEQSNHKEAKGNEVSEDSPSQHCNEKPSKAIPFGCDTKAHSDTIGSNRNKEIDEAVNTQLEQSKMSSENQPNPDLPEEETQTPEIRKMDMSDEYEFDIPSDEDVDVETISHYKEPKLEIITEDKHPLEDQNTDKASSPLKKTTDTENTGGKKNNVSPKGLEDLKESNIERVEIEEVQSNEYLQKEIENKSIEVKGDEEIVTCKDDLIGESSSHSVEEADEISEVAEAETSGKADSEKHLCEEIQLAEVVNDQKELEAKEIGYDEMENDFKDIVHDHNEHNMTKKKLISKESTNAEVVNEHTATDNVPMEENENTDNVDYTDIKGNNKKKSGKKKSKKLESELVEALVEGNVDIKESNISETEDISDKKKRSKKKMENVEDGKNSASEITEGTVEQSSALHSIRDEPVDEILENEETSKIIKLSEVSKHISSADSINVENEHASDENFGLGKDSENIDPSLKGINEVKNVEVKSPKKKSKKLKKRTEVIKDNEIGKLEAKEIQLVKSPIPEPDGKEDEHSNGVEVQKTESPEKKYSRKLEHKLTSNSNSNVSPKKRQISLSGLEPFANSKLDEYLSKKISEIESDIESYEETSDEQDEESDKEENEFICTMAEEGEEDTPSEGSNDIIDEGESIHSTESEIDSDDDYDEDDSFICDEEEVELLSGNEYDLGEEKEQKKNKKSRIIQLDDCDDDIIKFKRKEKPPEPEGKKKRSRIITVSDSSDTEGSIDVSKEEHTEVIEAGDSERGQSPQRVIISEDKSYAEVQQDNEVMILEDSSSIELAQELAMSEACTSMLDSNISENEDQSRKNKRKSSITIHENISVSEIKDAALSERISNLVDTFCTSMKKGEISMNLSLEYALKDSSEGSPQTKDEEIIEEIKKQKVKSPKRPKKLSTLSDNTSESDGKIGQVISKSPRKKLRKDKSAQKRNVKAEESLSVSGSSEDTSPEDTSPKRADRLSITLDNIEDLDDSDKKLLKKKRPKKSSSLSGDISESDGKSGQVIINSPRKKLRKYKSAQKKNVEAEESLSVSGSSDDTSSENTSPKRAERLSITLDNIEDSDDSDKKLLKRRRLSKSLENLSEGLAKKKKKKKTDKSWKKELVSKKKTSPRIEKKIKKRSSEYDLRTQTFSIMNQLITDVKKRPARTIFPSRGVSDMNSSWITEIVDVKPSTTIVSRRERTEYKSSSKIHPKDFRSQMLYDSSRVKRVDTKTLLKKRGAYF